MTDKEELSRGDAMARAAVLEVVAWSWDYRGRHMVTTDYSKALELAEPPYPTEVEPLIRLSDYQRLQADHEKLQAETERLQAARAADKVRIAELEAERDEWHRLFDSAGQLSKNACDDLNSAKSRIAELEAALRNIAAEVDGNIRECVRDCVNQRGNVQDIYEYCDRIDSTVGAALAQQGKEGE